MSNNDRLISLEERMDAQLHAFGYERNDWKEFPSIKPGAHVGKYENFREDQNGYSPSGVKRSAAVIGGGALASYGAAKAYKNRDAIKTGAKKVAAAGIEKTAGGVDALGEQMRKRHWKATANGSKSKIIAGLGKGSEAAGRLSKTIRGASKYLSSGEIHAITHLAERIALLELEADDELRDFRDGGRTNGEAYRDRAVMIGGVGAAGLGAGAAYKYSPKFKGAVDGAREGTKQGYATAKKSAAAGYESAKASASKGVNATRSAVRDGYQSGKSAAIVGSAQAKKKLVQAGADVGSRLRTGKSGLMAKFAKVAK